MYTDFFHSFLFIFLNFIMFILYIEFKILT